MADTINREELLINLNINSDTLNQYQKEGLPIHKKGVGRSKSQYILQDVIDWLDANGKKYGETKESLQEAKTRREIALATMAELELKELEGELVRIDDITKEFERQLINVRQKLLTIPSKVSGVVLGMRSINEIKQAIEDQIYIALEELTKQQEVVDHPEDYEQEQRDNKKSSKRSTKATSKTEAI